MLPENYATEPRGQPRLAVGALLPAADTNESIHRLLAARTWTIGRPVCCDDD